MAKKRKTRPNKQLPLEATYLLARHGYTAERESLFARALHDVLAESARDLERRYPDVYEKVREVQAQPGWEPAIPNAPIVVTGVCEYCNKPFLIEDRHLGDRRYCSKSCSNRGSPVRRKKT